MNAHYRQAGHLESLANGATVFAGNAETKLSRLRAELIPLAARCDVVVANPVSYNSIYRLPIVENLAA